MRYTGVYISHEFARQISYTPGCTVQNAKGKQRENERKQAKHTHKQNEDEHKNKIKTLDKLDEARGFLVAVTLSAPSH